MMIKIITVLILAMLGTFALIDKNGGKPIGPPSAQPTQRIAPKSDEGSSIFIPFLSAEQTTPAAPTTTKKERGSKILPLIDIDARQSDQTSTPFQYPQNPQKQKPPESYYVQLVDIWNKGFTPEEFAALKKNSDGRPFLAEELAQQMSAGANLNELTSSLLAWQALDERTVTALESLSEYQNASYHQALINWYKYRLRLVEELKGGPPPEKINILLYQFRKNSENELRQSALSRDYF
ncbi:MAG: hypothetical protein HZA37_00200 [Parcubacteria group bacterium]|nr:hypothetical protein [Parcubacteria group bacterium]